MELDARRAPEPAPEPETEAEPAPEPERPKPPRDSYGTQILSAEESAAIRRGAAGHPGTEPEDGSASEDRFTPGARFEEPDASAARTQEAHREAEHQPEPAPHRDHEPSLAYEPDADDHAHHAAPEPAPVPSPEPPPVAPVSPPRAAAGPRPSVTTRRLAGPLAPPDSGDERREEARRFAKLLVSEIKLYNERAVQEGRTRNDLYQRLKEDIDRSRQMYDERIPADVRSNTNFFYEELVRILADGRAEALGI